MRVGADSGLGAKYIARGDAKVVGMFGSGGMARSHIEAFQIARNIKKVQVYSPTKAHREEYAREMKEKHRIETVALDNPEDVYKGTDILADCTDAIIPVILGKYIEKGTHITSVKSSLDEEGWQRIDASLRFGNATTPIAHEEITTNITYATPQIKETEKRSGYGGRGGVQRIDADKVVYFKDILENKKKGRKSPRDITYSERGNMQGAQFHAVAGKVYEVARERGIGREIPTEWFLQDIRD